MALMDESAWRGKIFLGGWTAGGGGDAPVIEPATGQEIGRIGMAAPADVARAAQVAAAAQAGVGRAAAHRAVRHPPQSRGPLAGQRGRDRAVGDPGKRQDPARHAVRDARGHQEIYEAATLPSRPYGELLPSEQPRLSFAERIPVGVAGVIAPFNFPQILSIRSVAPALALGNAVILKPDPRTAVSGGSCWPVSSRRPACRTGCCTCCPAAPTSARP